MSYQRVVATAGEQVEPAFELIRPDPATTGVIFASPHSGRLYSRKFTDESILSTRALRSSEDAFVDRLFDAAPRNGAPFLKALTPRAWIDLNRAPNELDPALIDGIRRGAHNPRVLSGLGVIPRVVAGGRAIYAGKISAEEARARIDAVWRPYHAQLSALLDEARRSFGHAILVDCHSMPREALDAAAGRAKRPEVVLGDRFGTAASADVVGAIESIFADAGLEVSRNAPFAGAYTAQHYGRPARGVHVVQVEIDRTLYMDEFAIAPHGGFDAFKRRIDTIVARIADLGRPGQVMVEAAE